MTEKPEVDIATLVKRGGKRVPPEALHVQGYDKGHSAYDVLEQVERGRSMLPVPELAAVARAWGDIEQGGPARAEELAVEAASAKGIQTKDVLEDARLALSLASGFPIINAVAVAPDGTERLVVVDGRRRVVCARAANIIRSGRGERPITVPIEVQRGDKATLARAMGVGNEQRRANSILARAEDARAAADTGADIETVALDLGVSRSGAANLIALGRMLRDLSTEALTALRSGQVKPSAVYSIARDVSLTIDERSTIVMKLATVPKERKPALKPRVTALVEAVRSGDLEAARAALEALPEFMA